MVSAPTAAGNAISAGSGNVDLADDYTIVMPIGFIYFWILCPGCT